MMTDVETVHDAVLKLLSSAESLHYRLEDFFDTTQQTRNNRKAKNDRTQASMYSLALHLGFAIFEQCPLLDWVSNDDWEKALREFEREGYWLFKTNNTEQCTQAHNDLWSYLIQKDWIVYPRSIRLASIVELFASIPGEVALFRGINASSWHEAVIRFHGIMVKQAFDVLAPTQTLAELQRETLESWRKARESDAERMAMNAQAHVANELIKRVEEASKNESSYSTQCRDRLNALVTYPVESSDIVEAHLAKEFSIAIGRFSKTNAGVDAELRGTPAVELTQESPIGYLGGASLADALEVHPSRRDAFFQKLMRRRPSLGDECWHEVSDPGRNGPQYLYRVDSTRLRELAAAYKGPKQI